MSQLSARQKRISVIGRARVYLLGGQRSASKHLVEKYKPGYLSSATVRNEMSALTDEGYPQTAAYTSAGRVPTEDGYRYFVGQLMQDTALPEATAPHDQPPILANAQ